MFKRKNQNDTGPSMITVFVVIVVTLLLKDSAALINLSHTLGIDNEFGIRLLGAVITLPFGVIALLTSRKLLQN